MDRQVQLERANHVLNAMGVDTRRAVVKDRTQYITFDAKNSGSIVELLDSNTRKLSGVTSFDANKLNKGRYFVIDAMRVLTDGSADSVKTAKWNSEADKAIINSELSISQDEELLNLPVSDLISKINVQDNKGFRPIASAPVIVPEKEINMRWVYPNGVNVDSSTTQLVRIELRGFEFFVS